MFFSIVSHFWFFNAPGSLPRLSEFNNSYGFLSASRVLPVWRKKKLENKSKPLDKSRVKWIIERLEEKVVTVSLTFYPENSVPNEKNGRVFNIEWYMCSSKDMPV